MPTRCIKYSVSDFLQRPIVLILFVNYILPILLFMLTTILRVSTLFTLAQISAWYTLLEALTILLLAERLSAIASLKVSWLAFCLLLQSQSTR